jgi:hypothetical protein
MTEFIIITLAVGTDYIRDLSQCLLSKQIYASKYGYKYIQAGTEWWDRKRPIAWSKIPVLLSTLRQYHNTDTIIWLSDADVLITNHSICLETITVSMGSKDLMWSRDSCGNWNSGNIFVRPTDWSIKFFEAVWAYTPALYHIWWENKAIIDLLSASPADCEHVRFITDSRCFNSYLQGCDGEDIWKPADFLVHFAGVYDSARIKQYSSLVLGSIDGGATLSPITIFPKKDYDTDPFKSFYSLENARNA